MVNQEQMSLAVMARWPFSVSERSKQYAVTGTDFRV